MAPRRRILLVIETADLARYAGFLESAASRWEILALSPSEALAQPIQEEPPDAVLVAVEGVPEGWLESWKRTEPRPLLIQLSAQVSAPRRAPAGPWDWILPAVSPASDLEAMLPFPSGEQRPTIAVRKVLLVGEATVGKTSLAAFYLRGQHLHHVVLSPDGKAVIFHEELFRGEFGRIRDVVMGPDGALYFTTSNRDGRGRPMPGDDRILRIVPGP